jgi:DNA-binding NarL/FixJ family response regulator
MQELNLSHRTVEIFVHQAVRRLQAKTRAHAVAIAIRGGTI